MDFPRKINFQDLVPVKYLPILLFCAKIDSMGTIVLKMTAKQISTLQKDLASYATATNNPYASFSAKVDGTSVIAYTSGKVTFQGAKPEILASRFGCFLEILGSR